MTIRTPLVLLGFGLGGLLIACWGSSREDPSQPALNDLRLRAIEAQRTSAEASRRERELTERWQRAHAAMGTTPR